MPLLVFRRHLGEDGARGKVGAVGFDAEGLGRVGRDENQSGGDTLFQPGESSSLSFFPVLRTLYDMCFHLSRDY